MNPIPLSPYHKIFYNEWQIAPLSNKYNIVIDQTISHTLDIPRLKCALERLIADYLILNCHMANIDGEPYWVENSYIRSLEVFQGIASYEQLYQYVAQPFNVEEEPLYRFAIFNQEDCNYRFIIVWHHLIMDGSAGEIFELISTYYNKIEYNSQISISEQHKQIVETTSLLNEQVKQNSNNNRKFWRELLENIEAIDLTFLRPAKYLQSNIPETHINPIQELSFCFKEDDFRKLSATTRKYGITPYMYSQCIFAILIYYYTNQTRFGFAYPITIKEHSGLLYGVTINTNIQPLNLNGSLSISDLITQSKQITTKLRNKVNNYKYCPINDIMLDSNKNILDVFFTQTEFRDKKFEFNGVTTISTNFDFQIDISSKLLIEQDFQREQKSYKFIARYDHIKIDGVILKQFIDHYQKLFKEILSDLYEGNVCKKISDYSALSLDEYNKVVYKFNNNMLDFPANKTVHQLFEEQVLKTPHNLALVYQDISLTYTELNKKANQLAHYILNTYLIKPDDLVALYLERNEYMIIAILAVLKAGGAYVPLDPSYPLERIELILNDTQARLLIINSQHINKLSKSIKYTNTVPALIALDSNNLQLEMQVQPFANPITQAHSSNLAYILYTSGTTGRPKGVMVEHMGCINRIIRMDAISGITSDKKVLFKTNYIFDVSFSDIFVTLYAGACLVLTKHHFDILEITNKIIHSSIDVCHFTPSQFEVIKATYGASFFSFLKILHFSGEALDHKILSGLASDIKCINYYGPTESGEVSAEIINLAELGIPVNIGSVFNNVSFFILNKNLYPSPLGGIGELYIGGVAIARGYINNIELTNERFINNPFQADKTRLYKSGDSVRINTEGKIEYLGRNDAQVKIRGYRVELAEVENCLNTNPQIKHAVVILQQPNNNQNNLQQPYLVAYYVAEAEFSTSILQEYLLNYLPDYMVPQVFCYIDRLPLNQNGKLNKHALPRVNYKLSDNYVAPSNALEIQVCDAYAELLDLPKEQIGITHDFFNHGGNSILAIRLVAKLQHNLRITVTDIFKLRTPAKIVKHVPYINNTLDKMLNDIKLIYTQNNSSLDKELESDKYIKYLNGIKHINFIKAKKPIANVLLTGSTGYLGCNILYQLLTQRDYKIYLLIRGASNEATYDRLNDIFKYYFEISLDLYKDRVVVLASNLEHENLGLSLSNYEKLTMVVDSIIHTAALVKHYASYEEFYRANVKATINLLEFCKLTHHKDFHYISTIGIFMNSYLSNPNNYLFTEDDALPNVPENSNFYLQTKQEGELTTLKYREHGINSNIYRVGNLSMNSVNYKNQKNINDNAFFIRVKTMLNLQIIPKELSKVEMSPVDFTALAIVKLFEQENLSNQIYHVFNPNLCDLGELFIKYKELCVKITTINEFINSIIDKLKQPQQTQQIELFMLHQLWLQDKKFVEYALKFQVFQDKTATILAKFGFYWPKISMQMLSDLVKQSFIEGGY